MALVNTMITAFLFSEQPKFHLNDSVSSVSRRDPEVEKGRYSRIWSEKCRSAKSLLPLGPGCSHTKVRSRGEF